MLKLNFRFFAALSWSLLLAACSSPPKQPEPLVLERRPVKEGHSSASSTFRVVEDKLRHTKGRQILISKELLQQLLEEQKASEQARARLSGQLEALKKIDREEPAKFVQ